MAADGRGRPVSEEEMVVVDAAARLGGPRELLRCARCGLTFRAGLGHLGSARCVVSRSLKELEAVDFVPIVEWSWVRYLEILGIEVRVAPGRVDTTTGSGLTRATVAERKFGPRWVVRYMRATMGSDSAVRLKVLKALVAGGHPEIKAGLSKPRGERSIAEVRAVLLRVLATAQAEVRAERRSR